MSSAALLALNPVFTLSLSFYEFIKPNVRYATKTNHIQVEQTRTTTRIANTSLCCSLRSDISSNFISKPWSLKSKTAATMVGRPKTFWKDQRAGGLNKFPKIEIYVIFAVFALHGRRTLTHFKNRSGSSRPKPDQVPCSANLFLAGDRSNHMQPPPDFI